MTRLGIALVASVRYPIRQRFAAGLEAPPGTWPTVCATGNKQFTGGRVPSRSSQRSAPWAAGTAAARRNAQTHWSVEPMVDGYEQVCAEIAA